MKMKHAQAVRDFVQAEREKGDNDELRLGIEELQSVSFRTPKGTPTQQADRILHRTAEEMKKSKWIKPFDIERSTQAKGSNLSTMLTMTLTVMSIGAISEYTIYLLRATGYKCKATQDSKLADEILNLLVVDKEMKGWRAKRNKAFGIYAISSVSMTTQNLHGYVSLMEEKAQIPSRY